jgi:hypothetical protein
VALVTVAGLAQGSAAKATVFGQLTPADVTPVGGHQFGAYLNASENIVGILAQLRLSFYDNVDFGFHGGLTRIDLAGSDVTTLRIGGDLKFLAMRASESFPVDLAFGGAVGVEAGDDINILSLGPYVVASRTLAMGTNGGIVPYGGMGVFFTQSDVGDAIDDNSVAFPLRMGVEFRLAQELRIITELEIPLNDDFRDDIGFSTGVNLPF